MNRSGWWMALLCVACGGSGAPAESPADAEETPADAGSETSEAPPATQEEPSQPTSEAPATTGTGSASQEDVRAVLQLVIEDEELNPFLHLDRPERFPLKIAGEIPAGLTLTKATKPVEIVDASEGKAKPVLVFTEINVAGNKASVRYRYDIEGVRGACSLEKRDGTWVLARSRITER
jgi:hypothetical protein